MTSKKKPRKCLWMKAVGKHLLLSWFNCWLTPMFWKLEHSFIFQVGWLSLYYTKRIREEDDK